MELALSQRSAGTFPTGLRDGEIMFENPAEHSDRMDTRFFNRVLISSWGSRGFPILIYPSGRPVGNVPDDLFSNSKCAFRERLYRFVDYA